jgi:hypothetical protein
VDVFADRGTPVLAAADGIVSHSNPAGAGGLALRLTTADGTYYYYAHLDRIATGARAGARVSKGDVVGFVGTTGNAEGGMPHLHFEIHPDGGAAVPPVPYLDRWLADAMDAARALQLAPPSAVEALREGRITAAAGLPPRLTGLQHTASTKSGPRLWPLFVVLLVGVAGWRLWIRYLRSPAAEPQAGDTFIFFD